MNALALVLLAAAVAGPEDLRELYDVRAYHLDLRVDPAARELSGQVTIEIEVVTDELSKVRLDLADGLVVAGVRVAHGRLGGDGGKGRGLYHKHAGDVLDCVLTRAARRGEHLLLTVDYAWAPTRLSAMRGLRWETGDGEPLADVNVQSVGAHHWFPCKTARDHPEDRADRVWVDLLVPADMIGVSNGRLAGTRAVTEAGEKGSERREWKQWQWRHEYPLATYGVALAVGRYEEVATRLELPGLEDPLLFVYYVRPSTLERAAVQFAEVREILEVYSRAFGPWPFPDAKVALVEGAHLTAEHSTAMSYGSSYPAWLKQEGLEDPKARINLGYDYVLVHQLAHEWWGNAVAARSWHDFWLHEGFATYAESLWLEHRGGREASDEFFRELASRIDPHSAMIPKNRDATMAEAFHPGIYQKGAWILHMARHRLNDDAAWWRTLQIFQARHRYGSASTADFRATLEEVTEADWSTFFDEWVYGTNTPRLSGTVQGRWDRIEVRVENTTRDGRSFHVPLDLRWTEAGDEIHERVQLEPGTNRIDIPCGAHPRNVRIENLHRVLGYHSVTVEDRRR